MDGHPSGALRHRWSLPYQRASEEGLKSELELRLESLCGWRRMRAAAPADRRISVRQVTLSSQLVYRAQRSGRAKNCRRSCRTRRERPRPVGVLVELVHCARRLARSTSTVSRDESRRSLERRSATQARCDVARGLVRSEIDLPRNMASRVRSPGTDLDRGWCAPS